ncbi:WD repeat- and FYVE domain-containing protein 4 [Scleropages formosus]|nr:WD repeat- and FYVE domain-containing protein 4 [Scleropages formosus]
MNVREPRRITEGMNEGTEELALPGQGEGTGGASQTASMDQGAWDPVVALRDQLALLGRSNQCNSSAMEEDVVKILSLFIQVSQSGGAGAQLDLRVLAHRTAQIVASSIQQKVLEKPAEEARCEVEFFFERKAEVKNNRGWLLLQSLSLLATQSSEVVVTMIGTGLPSALVKCLYLFVAFPPVKDTALDEVAQPSFQDLFTQVILQLCDHSCCVEVLVETQELQCLIIALTSLWDQCSSSWRRQASRVLKAVSSAQTSNTVSALKAKDCIKISIQNLLKIPEQIPGPVLAEVAVGVFSFVKDSYPHDPALFEEFESNEGYAVLKTIMSRCEEGVTAENVQAVKDFLRLLATFTLYGRAELKVAVCVSNPQPPGFKFDPFLTKGSSVKNLTAFRIIQSSFFNSENVHTCSQILHTIRHIWLWDKANFFLLEWTLQSLAQLAGCVSRKPPPVHLLFFELVELVVLHLSYIPHETLREVQRTVEQGASLPFSVAALDSFHRLILQTDLICDVLRDSGMLQLLLVHLKKQAKVLRKAGVTGKTAELSDISLEKHLTCNMLKVVAVMALKSVRNTVSIKDFGMIPYVKIFIDDEQLRGPALSILEQLSQMNPEEYMSSTIGALCSSTEAELALKRDLLQSIVKVVEEPNCWNAFRTVGGFTGLISVLVDMEGALLEPPMGLWASLPHPHVMEVLFLTLHTLAVAVQVHSVNSHLFHAAGHYERLAEALLNLGCFQKPPLGHSPVTADHGYCRTFLQLLEVLETPGAAMPQSLQECIRLLAYLEQFALGVHQGSELTADCDGPEDPIAQTVEEEDEPRRNRKAACSVSSATSDCGNRFDQTILYPGAVQVIMTLLPNIFSSEDPQLSMELQLSVAHHIQSLVKSERNRQIMCEAGLLRTLLIHCQDILDSEENPLHLPVVRIFEKLASQAIDPAGLRQFLCLGHPLMCESEKSPSCPQAGEPAVPNDHGSNVSEGSKTDDSRASSRKLKHSYSILTMSTKLTIPHHRTVSLVSMTSPRSFQPHSVSATPSFVEFNMSSCGYGCLFLPSLATVKGVSADATETGGIGSDCRGFPPAAGLSFSTWFLISHFSSARDAHPVRLLTVLRHMSRAELQYTCLAVTVTFPDRCLLISMEEEPFQFLDMMEPEVQPQSSLPSAARFKCSRQLLPAQWHHLVVTIAKDVKKSCIVTAYLNGTVIGVSKMKYIQPFPGPCISMDPTAVIDVCGIIGTPSLWKQLSPLCWRAGPAYLFEEVLTPESIEIIYKQGTKYLGNFQSLCTSENSTSNDLSPVKLIAEERISFGINPAVSSVTTVAEIRDLYNEVDCRLIAKEVGIPSRDNYTPIFFTKNIAQHLSGTSRTIGASLVGHSGVRTFTSNSAADSFLYIGGPAVVLSLVAMASDDSSMYTAVKVMLSVLSTSPYMEREMNRIKGYKLLAFLLKKKACLISSRTFQLLLSIVGTMELGSSLAHVQNHSAFLDLLCDFEVWQKAPENLDLFVLNHFADILKSPSSGSHNARVMCSLGLVPRLLFLLCGPTVTCHKVTTIATVMEHLLKGYFNAQDICRLGLFLVYTLLPSSLNENVIFSGMDFDVTSQALSQTPARTIWIRNQLLEMLLSLTSSDSSLSARDQEEMFCALGPDWFLLFLHSHLHSSTVLSGLMLLTRFLPNPLLLNKFREGISPGAVVIKMKEEPSIVIENLRPQSWSHECMSSACPGFQVLQKLLVHHVKFPQVYGVLAHLLLQKTDFESLRVKVDIDSVLQGAIDSVSSIPGLMLCADVAVILLELIRAIISKPSMDTKDSWQTLYPGSIMQFFCLIHSLYPQDPLWVSTDFLHALAGTIFPTEAPEDLTPLLPLDSPELEAPLSRATHPARKQVCDFIRILLMDSLINIPARTETHPFVLLLEFSPEMASHEQKQIFQTEVLEFLMDIVHMTCQEEGQCTHVAREDTSDHKSRPSGKIATLIENVAFFSKKLVEKLYTGMFVAEPEKILVFIAEQIVVVMEKAHGQRENTVSILYNSVNRALLYFLSRPRQTPAEQRVMVRTLQVLNLHWDVILATYNANINFLTCLLHCLFLIKSGSYTDGFGCKTHKKHKKIWHYLFSHKNNHQGLVCEASDSEVESQMQALAESTWCRLMAERRTALEEAYRIDISTKPGGRDGPVNMADISPLWEETGVKAWQLFIEAQKKKLNRAQQKPNPLRAAMLSAQRRLGKDPCCSPEEYLMCMEAQRTTGQEIFESLLKNHTEMLRCQDACLERRWRALEEELLRERGLFGPGPGVLVQWGWVQDGAEGPGRMRPRIRRQALRRSKKFPVPHLGLHLKCNPMEENKGRAESYEMDTDPRILCEAGKEVEEDGLDCDRLTFFPLLNEHSSPIEELPERCTEMHIILQELAEGEELRGKLSVVTVNGHVITEGVLLFGKAHLYICEDYTLSPSGDVCCKQHHSTSVRDSFICSMFNKEKSAPNPTCRTLPYEEIKDVHFMRFLLEDNALEIYMRNGHSVFLVFQNKDHMLAFKRLCSVVPSLKGRGVTEAIANFRKVSGGDKTALHKWQKGEMTNFEYLMHLNTLAGRTYNDLMQYPVFPWILADYDSETLDLTSPSTFRDLSKPMGAQTDRRKEKFIQRYNEIENNDGDLSAQCHYCTHYSSAIIVASFLVRMEPFSQTFLCLQGGSFDVADRMFHCVKKDWESASRNNMSDVRELIPEFYYLPDFLVNSNSFELGCLQDGTPLGDVVLPPWAKGDPQEFIRMHREALECDYVSAHLHLWIDLIFGFKQQGPAAVEAINTFHPYFYAEKLDVDNLKDPLKKHTILGYVSNFGQIPKQLLSKPHPPRTGHKSSVAKELSAVCHLPPFFFRMDKLKPSIHPLKELTRGPVGQIVCGEKEILVVEKNRVLMPPQWSTVFSWGFHDNTCAFGSYGTEKHMAICENLVDWGGALCAACPNPTTIVTAGTRTVVCVWEVSISKDRLKHMKIKQVLYGHTDVVTCLVASEAHSIIVSGSRDRTCILWDLEDLSYITQLPGHNAALTSLAINELTGEIASCAGELLYLWTMKGQLLSWINTSCGPEGNILCCCFTQRHEWDSRNVIVTGCADGIVRIWKTEYSRTQLPAEHVQPSSHESALAAPEEAGKAWERHLVLCQELNRSQAVSRRRYRNNPAVTALAVSRTHSTLLVGDAWGRVFSWFCEG